MDMTAFLSQVALGTVTNIEEAVKWLSYTYLYVRMRCNPLVYGINYNTVEVCPNFSRYCKQCMHMPSSVIRNRVKVQSTHFETTLPYNNRMQVYVVRVLYRFVDYDVDIVDGPYVRTASS